MSKVLEFPDRYGPHQTKGDSFGETMQIKGNNSLPGLDGAINRVENSERQARVDRQERQNAPAKSDRLELSIRGREIQQLDSLIQSSPDVRTEKVEQIRSAIADGTYNVKAEQIADKIISGNLIDQ